MALVSCNGDFYRILQSLIYLVESFGFSISLEVQQSQFDAFELLRALDAAPTRFNRIEFLSVLMPHISHDTIDPSTGIPLLAFLCIYLLANNASGELVSSALLKQLDLLCIDAPTATSLPILATLIYAGNNSARQRVVSRLLESGCDPNRILPFHQKIRSFYILHLSKVGKTGSSQADGNSNLLVEFLEQPDLHGISLLFVSTLIGDTELVQTIVRHGGDIALVILSFLSARIMGFHDKIPLILT